MRMTIRCAAWVHEVGNNLLIRILIQKEARGGNTMIYGHANQLYDSGPIGQPRKGGSGDVPRYLDLPWKD